MSDPDPHAGADQNQVDGEPEGAEVEPREVDGDTYEGCDS